MDQLKTMSLNTYLVLHLSSIFVLLGYTFYAFAAPAETRKRVLMITGVATVLILVTGVGMLHRLHHNQRGRGSRGRLRHQGGQLWHHLRLRLGNRERPHLRRQLRQQFLRSAEQHARSQPWQQQHI